MRRLKTIIIIFLAISSSAFAQFTLNVEITDLRNNNGYILYELFDQHKKSLKVGNEIITKNKSVIVIENLKPGKYGFNYIHDENKNKKLDTKLFIIPKEGYGYSNNPVAKFGPPDFKKWIFEVKDNLKISCKTTYLNY
jgi:uncharacterized protein (DUF2141 family)